MTFQGSVELKVIDKIVHPKYNFFTYEYDLALVKLERRITFQENMIPICLPGNDDTLVGKFYFLLGTIVLTQVVLGIQHC